MLFVTCYFVFILIYQRNLQIFVFVFLQFHTFLSQLKTIKRVFSSFLSKIFYFCSCFFKCAILLFVFSIITKMNKETSISHSSGMFALINEFCKIVMKIRESPWFRESQDVKVNFWETTKRMTFSKFEYMAHIIYFHFSTQMCTFYSKIPSFFLSFTLRFLFSFSFW